MLKAYAVALALTTSAPIADKVDGVKNAEQNKPVVTQRDKPRTSIGW